MVVAIGHRNPGDHRFSGGLGTKLGKKPAAAPVEKPVESPDQLRPALERAFASGKPALVNILTDPEVVYPRKANLA